MLYGCRPGDTAQQRAASNRSAREGANQRGALFESIRSQLRTLPERTALELRPPAVVLDARNSTNGEEILGALLRRPDAPPGAPANLIRVPSRNSDFKRHVRPGDILKYYARLDDATLQRLEATGDVDIATFEAVEFIVAQVISDNELLIEGGVPQEVDALFKVEVWRIDDQRMADISRDLNSYLTRRDPPLAWHPSPDELTITRLTERLNQWLRQTGAAAVDWTMPERLEGLPAELSDTEELRPYLSEQSLRSGLFRDDETRHVQGAIWRRDVARWARGPDPSPLAIAERLTEWVGKNIQLVPDDESPPRWPWELMLHGKATVEGRAWVLAGLLEQLNITPAIVSLPVETFGDYPLVGVSHDGQLWLFDPKIGMQLHSAEGKPASLVSIGAADEATVSLVASPFSLTRRAALLEERLTGDDAVLLAVDSDAVAERIASAEGVEEVGLWPEPFQTLLGKLRSTASERRRAVREFLPFAWRPKLWKGRALHLRGVVQSTSARDDPLVELLDDHREAARLYLDPNVRPPDTRLAGVAEDKRVIYERAKLLATLWLGLLAAEQGDDEVAVDWLENRVFEGADADEIRPIVHYNLALAKARLGQTDEAVTLLEGIEGPMAPAARLAAERLAAASRGDDVRSADDSPSADKASTVAGE